MASTLGFNVGSWCITVPYGRCYPIKNTSDLTQQMESVAHVENKCGIQWTKISRKKIYRIQKHTPVDKNKIKQDITVKKYPGDL